MTRTLMMLVFVMAGCAGKPEVNEDFTDLEEVDQKSDAFSWRMKIVGSLDYGQQSAAVKYTSSPRFRAFKFAGQKGDKVDVWVRSPDGDAVAWVLDDSFRTLGANDDANPSTLDARIQVTLPGNRRPEIVTYYVVFRDYDLLPATYTVELKGPAGCSYDGERYAVGDSFKSSDGCNTCSCGPAGVACTKRACLACNPQTEHNRKYVGDSSTCARIRYLCETGTTHFSNACGCGCEQPADCPAWINCMPGPGRTPCAAERARCPLSQVAY
jgi:hypothetical protein